MTRRFFSLAIFLISVSPAQLSEADTDVGTLLAVIEPGKLEIVSPASISLETEIGDAIATNGEHRADFITFNIENIIVNDFNGDGRGWRLDAIPTPLELQNSEGADELPIGMIVGFQNPSHTVHTVYETPNRLTYSNGQGVAGFSVDYRISFDLPAFSAPGSYSGEVRFEITAL